LVEQAQLALARAQGAVSSARRRRFLNIALELTTQVNELGASEGITQEARDIFDQAKALLDDEIDQIRAALDEEASRWLWLMQGSLGPVKRAISTEGDGEPISGEGGGAINPEDS